MKNHGDQRRAGGFHFKDNLITQTFVNLLGSIEAITRMTLERNSQLDPSAFRALLEAGTPATGTFTRHPLSPSFLPSFFQFPLKAAAITPPFLPHLRPIYRDRRDTRSHSRPTSKK